MRPVLMLLLLSFGAVAQDAEKQPQPSKTQVWGFAKDGVKHYLKSPSSASFGGILGDIQDPEKAVQKLTADTWGVTGWVDASNGFGAIIRQSFYIELQLINTTLHVEYIEMDGKKLAGTSVLPKLAEQLKEFLCICELTRSRNCSIPDTPANP